MHTDPTAVDIATGLSAVYTAPSSQKTCINGIGIGKAMHLID